jgi:hypothetical protein
MSDTMSNRENFQQLNILCIAFFRAVKQSYMLKENKLCAANKVVLFCSMKREMDSVELKC